MTPCSVCGKQGEPLSAVRADFSGGELRWVEGRSPGASCSPECATLVYVRPVDLTTDEMVLTAWAWRTRRAAVRGERFDEPPPFSATERAAILEQRRLSKPARGAA